MNVNDLVAEVRDGTLKRLGIIQPEDLDLTFTVLFNNVGQWTLTLSSDHERAIDLLTPGAGLIVYGPDDVLFSGPTTSPAYALTADAPRGLLTITGVTDDIHLADRLCYPLPSQPDVTKQTAAHDARTGDVESVIHGYVNANLGPGAPAVRRHPYLTMGTNSHRGPNTSQAARFETLGPYVADIAKLANLGFRIVQRNAGLVFETYAVTDRSKFIRLDVLNDTLAAQTLAITAPTATEVIVGGQGDLTDRTFYQGTSDAAQAAEAAWGRRIEVFVDQTQTDDQQVYVDAATQVLADQGFTNIAAGVQPMDNTDSQMVFGRDWTLGDNVAIVGLLGEYTAPVSGMAVSANSDGFSQAVAIGDISRLDTNVLDPRVAALARRVAQLERSA